MLRKLAAVAATVTATVGLAAAVVPAHAGSSKAVSVKNNGFSPGSVAIAKGGKLTWKWTQGAVPHNVTPARGYGSKTSSKKGTTFTKTFTKAGTFKYHCTIHSSMKMTVKVS